MEHQRTRPLVGNGLIHRHHARLLSNGGLEQQVPERSISCPFVGVIIAPSPATENLSIYSRRRQAARKAASCSSPKEWQGAVGHPFRKATMVPSSSATGSRRLQMRSSLGTAVATLSTDI